jgi:hypothetical protein
MTTGNQVRSLPGPLRPDPDPDPEPEPEPDDGYENGMAVGVTGVAGPVS